MGVIIPETVKTVLRKAGWEKVTNVPDPAKVARLQELLDTLYVDNRRKVQVEALEEARRLAGSL